MSFIKAGKTSLLLLLSIPFFTSQANAQGGTWTPLTNAAPDYNEGEMLLLSDGTVICKTSSGPDGYGNVWDKLTPDSHGSYLNGTWSTIAPMINTRLYFSTQVMKDGRVYAAGGEYGSGGSSGEVYNPLTNTWTACPPLSGGEFISDANSEILPDGRILQAIVGSGSNRMYLYNPIANAYATGPSIFGNDNESAWVKLPDNSILFVDILSTSSERYIPASNTWVHDATVPVGLYDPYGEETGAAFLLPNGKAFFIGSTPTTAIYTPSGGVAQGTWVAGPAIPNAQGAPDAAAAMMVNGKILFTVSPTATNADHFPPPQAFYEYDYVTNTISQVGAPGGGLNITTSAFLSNMVDLPDGTVLFANQGDDQYYEYTPANAPLAAGKPTLDSIIQIDCTNYTITGKLFNGITEGAAYGDDWQMSTNYPIVRMTSGTNVWYARSSNWNRTSVMTGNLLDTAKFALPAGLAAGTYAVQVIANGNASDPKNLTLGAPPITPASPSVCAGSNITLSNALGGGTWSSNNGNVTVNGSGVVHGVTAGTSVITYSVSATCTATTTVTVSTAPTTPTGITRPPQICQGFPATFTTPLINGVTYVWTITGTGWSGTSNTNSIDVTVGTGMAVIGCQIQTACGTSPSDTIQVTEGSPVAAAVTINVPALVCTDSVAIFETPVINNAASYNWVVSGNGWSGSSNTNSITVNVGTGPGTITVNGYNACSTGSSFTLTDIASATVPAAPVITAPAAICSGATATYMVAPVNGATSYVWQVAGTGWSGNSVTNDIDVTAGTGTAYIICQSENGCGNSVPDSVMATANTVPADASTINAPAVVCSGDTATFNTPTIPGATSYTWTVSGTGWSGTSTTNSITVTTGTDLGTISVQGVNACGTGNVYTMAITALTSPTANFAVSNHNINVNANTVVTYTGTATIGDAYTWNFGGGTGIPGTGMGPHNVHWTTTGMKYVSLTVSNGNCTSTVYMDSVLVGNPENVNIVNGENGIDIAPNPNDGTFEIIFAQPVTHAFTVKVMDIQGKVLYSKQFDGTNGHTVSIATSHLPNATYTASIEVNGTTINKKVIINR